MVSDCDGSDQFDLFKHAPMLPRKGLQPRHGHEIVARVECGRETIIIGLGMHFAEHAINCEELWWPVRWVDDTLGFSSHEDKEEDSAPWLLRQVVYASNQ